MWFLNKKDDVIKVNKGDTTTTIPFEEPNISPIDDYVFIEGYKGTDEYINCKGFKYELNTLYDLGEEPLMCRKGFHYCLNLKDVYKYYPLNGKNRYFRVNGLVKKSNADDVYNGKIDKLVAREIVFIEEIDVSEELNKLKEEKRKAKRLAYKDFLPFVTDEEIEKCLDDKEYIETILYNRFKKIGINENLSLILYDKMKFTRIYNEINDFCLERLYNKTIKLIEFAESLYKEDISNDMKLYLLLEEINKNNK